MPRFAVLVFCASSVTTVTAPALDTFVPAAATAAPAPADAPVTTVISGEWRRETDGQILDRGQDRAGAEDHAEGCTGDHAEDHAKDGGPHRGPYRGPCGSVRGCL